MTENKVTIKRYEREKDEIKKLILTSAEIDYIDNSDEPIKKYIDYANDEDIFLKRKTTPYEDFFEDFFKDCLKDFLKESDESSILKSLSQYELRHQIHWLVMKSEWQNSQIVFWDFALRNTKTNIDEIFIELDDGSHYKPNEDKYIPEDNDALKNKCIKRFGYYLIRIKAANYMYGFKNLKSLSESVSTSKDDADSQKYNVAFIAPYGKPLLRDHLKKCLELALHHKGQPYKGAYICCPDGYKNDETNTDDMFSESTHKTTYRSDIFSLDNDFQFNLNYIKNK